MDSEKQDKNKSQKEEMNKNEEKVKLQNNEIIEKKEDGKNKNKEIKLSKEENKEKNKKQKTRMILLIVMVIVIVILLFFSIIFAIININKTTYIDGISVKGIDISGMTYNEAKNKLEKQINLEFINSVEIMYNDEVLSTINPKDIDFNYDLNKQLKELYLIGRSGNIFKNNYEILFTMLLKKDMDLTYTYNKDTLENIIKDTEINIPNLVKSPTYYKEGEELIIVPGTDGVIIDIEKLEKLILEKIINSDTNKIENSKIQIPTLDKKAEEIDIEKIHQEIYCEPQDAYYVEEPFELHMDKDGVDFAITLEEAKNIVNSKLEEYKIPLKITKASVTINDIDSSAFRYKVSEFSTNYDAGYKSRTNNLQLATGKINGKILAPGEEFSFNEVVGKRTIEAGYKDAKIFVNGEVVDGTGGGICQVSTTLYNAVLLANLEVTDRRNHNYTTSYVKPGRDATVVYGAIDFKFKNNRKYPIKLEGTVSGGTITFNIYGIEEENEYNVKIIPVVTQTTPKTTQYIDDSSLVEGSEVVKQVGSSGCKVTTYKEVYLNGTQISNEAITNDTYKVMPKIVRRGTKKASVPVVSEPVQETPPVVETPSVEQSTEQTPAEPEVQDTTR